MQQSKYFESDIGLGGAEICGFVAAYLGFADGGSASVFGFWGWYVIHLYLYLYYYCILYFK